MSDTATPPLLSPRAQRRQDSDVQRWEQYSEGANLADSIGRSSDAERARRIAARLQGRNPGYDFGGVDVQQFNDWKDYAPGTSDLATRGLMGLARRDVRGSDDPSRALNHRQIQLRQSLEGATKTGLINEIDPSLQAAQTRADSFAGQAAIGAGEEQAMRSRISAMVRSAESQRMSRIGATLGYGNMGNSPAAAALASQAADEADQSIVGSLRDLGLQVGETNRRQARMDTELATRIASQRFALHNGDAKSLIDMQGEIASTIDALYSRDRTMAMQEKQIAEAGKQSTADRIGQWAGIYASLMSGGASAAAMGGGGSGGGAATGAALAMV